MNRPCSNGSTGGQRQRRIGGPPATDLNKAASRINRSMRRRVNERAPAVRSRDQARLERVVRSGDEMRYAVRDLKLAVARRRHHRARWSRASTHRESRARSAPRRISGRRNVKEPQRPGRRRRRAEGRQSAIERRRVAAAPSMSGVPRRRARYALRYRDGLGSRSDIAQAAGAATPDRERFHVDGRVKTAAIVSGGLALEKACW
jgi:hypothetical protein